MPDMFSEYSTSIPETWIDYNEHMNDAAYAIAISLANEAFLEHLGLSAEYRERTGRTMYTVDLHLQYEAEVHRSETLHANTEVSELGSKKLRLRTTLVRSDGVVAARSDVLYLHYDQGASAVIPFAAEQSTELGRWLAREPSGA